MGIGFVGALTLLLVAAKLFGFATYGWLVAFSPVLIVAGITAAFFIFAGLVAVAAAIGAKKGKFMILALAFLPLLGGCGYSARDNEMIGQVKKVMRNTPLICPEYYDVDLSLGVLRNGQGSMSKEDVWLRVMNEADVTKLKDLADRGAIIKVKYDVRRATMCYTDHNLLYFEEVK